MNYLGHPDCADWSGDRLVCNRVMTRGGRLFCFDHPRPEDVDIHDIAYALARIPRYNAHTDRPWSVAQHCMFVASMLPIDIAIYGLLHDAHEYVIGDISTPLKRVLGRERISELELSIDKAIYQAVGLAHRDDGARPDIDVESAVVMADHDAYISESREFMYVTPANALKVWAISYDKAWAKFPTYLIQGGDPSYIASMWMGAFFAHMSTVDPKYKLPSDATATPTPTPAP